MMRSAERPCSYRGGCGLVAAVEHARDRGELDEDALNEEIVTAAADAAASTTDAGITEKITFLASLRGRTAASDILVTVGVTFDGPWIAEELEDGRYYASSGRARVGPFAALEEAAQRANQENAYLVADPSRARP